MNMDHVGITRATRSLRFGWTNQPRTRTNPRTSYSWLEIEGAAATGHATTPRGILALYNAARHGNAANEWGCVISVGDRRIIGDPRDIIADLRDLVDGRVDRVEVSLR